MATMAISGEGVFNVREFGAVGDGVADDTQAIQLAIDAASRTTPEPGAKGGEVTFPAGKYRITATLVVSGQTGIQIRGTGLHGGDKLSHVGPRVTLTWDPPTTPSNPVLLRISGCNGMTLADIKFEGASEGRGAVTLLEIEDTLSDPSLFNSLVRVAFANAEIGIRAVNEAGGQMVFEHLLFTDLTTGFVTTEPGDTCYYFRYVDGNHCDTVLDFEAGGCLDAHFIQLVACGIKESESGWCLKFGGGGPNARCSRICVMHSEQHTEQLMRVIGDHRITVCAYTEGWPDTVGGDIGGTIVVDGSSLTFVASSLWAQPLILWSAVTGRKTTVHFRDCILNAATFTLSDWIPNATTEPGCYYSIERCDLIGNTPIPDQKSAW
jgi:hypothetical protein